jgi:hypothetical protein
LQTAAGVQLADGDILAGERFDNVAGAEGGGFDKGAIDLFGRGGEGESEQAAAEVGIHEDGAAAVPPIQGEQAGLAWREAGGLVIEPGITGELSAAAFGLAVSGQAVADEPIEHIADACLAGFIAPVAWDDAILDHTALSLDLMALGIDQQVAGGGADDHDQVPWRGDPTGGHGGMGVDIGGGDGCAWAQPGAAGHGGCELAGKGAQRDDGCVEFIPDNVG